MKLTSDFDSWFDLWDTTNDPEVRRLCGISWNASRAYARADGWITGEEIVGRAERKEKRWWRLYWLVWWCFPAAIVILIGITEPVHSWLHAHLELLLGFLLGTLAQSIPWLVDRWRWLRWFSWQ